MLKANTSIQTLSTFARWNFFLNLPCSYFQRNVCVFWGFVEFMFHGRSIQASLVLKAGSANLANLQGNISITDQRLESHGKQSSAFLVQEIWKNKWEKETAMLQTLDICSQIRPKICCETKSFPSVKKYITEGGWHSGVMLLSWINFHNASVMQSFLDQ